jgi:hypothetical protein
MISYRSIAAAAAAAATILFLAPAARAHCDTLDGPVAKAAQKALQDGNLFPVLAYAPASAEAEIRAGFEDARKVRRLNDDARRLADRAFMETVIRLHRAGEGASFSGLKPAGQDFGPVIKAAEDAIERGDLSKLKAALIEEIDHALAERFAHVREFAKISRAPTSAAEVPHARERVSAELGFITFAETIRQAAMGKGAEHHEE